MFNRIRQDDKGFTLIELLVVILIIGILAAIALPAFLGQRAKGQDSAAKSDVRNAVSQAESCFVESQAYNAAACTTEVSGAGLTVEGTTCTEKSGKIGYNPSAEGYVITACSKSGNDFTITRNATSGALARTCVTRQSKGSCNGSWTGT